MTIIEAGMTEVDMKTPETGHMAALKAMTAEATQTEVQNSTAIMEATEYMLDAPSMYLMGI